VQWRGRGCWRGAKGHERYLPYEQQEQAGCPVCEVPQTACSPASTASTSQTGACAEATDQGLPAPRVFDRSRSSLAIPAGMQRVLALSAPC